MIRVLHIWHESRLRQNEIGLYSQTMDGKRKVLPVLN
jgi:hypothetical protein